MIDNLVKIFEKDSKSGLKALAGFVPFLQKEGEKRGNVIKVTPIANVSTRGYKAVGFSKEAKASYPSKHLF